MDKLTFDERLPLNIKLTIFFSSVSAFQSTLAKLAVRLGMHAGSFTAWNMGSNLMVICLQIKQSEQVRWVFKIRNLTTGFLGLRRLTQRKVILWIDSRSKKNYNLVRNDVWSYSRNTVKSNHFNGGWAILGTFCWLIHSFSH